MKRVLIIEDHPDTAKLLSIYFQNAGFETKWVADTVPSINQITEFMPDIIITDLMLPTGMGLGVLQLLKLSVHTKSIPVIVFSGMDNDEHKKEIEAVGISAYFQKPCDTQKIVDKALELLGMK